jgi:hypothetical protein
MQQVRRSFDILICSSSVFHFLRNQNSECNNEEHYGNKQMLLIEFQISSATNEEHYGNKQTLCLNFKFRVQQMKSNMATSRRCV